MNGKNKLIIFFFVILLVLFGAYKTYNIVKSPHVMNTQEVLQKFSWKATTNNNFEKVVKFSGNEVIMGSNKYKYSFDNEDESISIKNGPLKGNYDLYNDNIDYNLKNTSKQSTPKSIYLSRID